MDKIMLKIVRWSSWPLLILVILFFITGYGISGRYGLGRFFTEQEALAFHKWLHLPLLVLTVIHSLPAIWLALVRWGWIKRNL